MFGEKLELVLMQCRVCKRWFALRVDKDDIQRHANGMFAQFAFTGRDGTPYLSPAELELAVALMVLAQ